MDSGDRYIPRLPCDASRPATPFLPAAEGYRQHRFSPDGRWLAYVADEPGVREVYVQPFPGPGGRHFIMSRLAGTIASPVVVLGWADEVRERLATAQRP